jgi:hypothetical protein
LGAFPDPLAFSDYHVFNDADRIFGVSDTPIGLFTVCSGRQDPTQIEDKQNNFGREESLVQIIWPYLLTTNAHTHLSASDGRIFKTLFISARQSTVNHLRSNFADANVMHAVLPGDAPDY